jgi:arabinose-5-phosphate isomerase
LTKATAASPADEILGGLTSAKRVLSLEAEGIEILADSLDESFSRALDLMEQMTDRVIVTGMGKSGHIANKIASTLASTGTPAIFVHPAEASHGDLGMITDDDVVIALSNSGETSELADLVNYTRRFKIPLIAITGRANSTLAVAADVALVLPSTPEACPMGLAPTTSTTVMLALGDALAVAMLERKGFSADDFHLLHPGGKLGRLLLRVSSVMHTGNEVPLIGGDRSMADALLTMTSKSFGCVGIVDNEGRLKGIVTDGDLRRYERRSSEPQDRRSNDGEPVERSSRHPGQRSARFHERAGHHHAVRGRGRTSGRYHSHPRLPPGGSGLGAGKC